MKNLKRKIVGYIRVSTIGQKVDGASLEAQSAMIENWVTVHGGELVNIHLDTISGKRADNRPGLQQAIAETIACKGILVFYALSRLSRSIRDTLDIAETLRKNDCDMASMTEDLNTAGPTGRLIFHLLTILNQFERELIGQRTKAALDHLRSQGVRTMGRIPYGFDCEGVQCDDDGRVIDGGRLVENSRELEGIERMMQLRQQGLSLRKIGAVLHQEGFAPKAAESWSAEAIHCILKRTEREAALVEA